MRSNVFMRGLKFEISYIYLWISLRSIPRFLVLHHFIFQHKTRLCDMLIFDIYRPIVASECPLQQNNCIDKGCLNCEYINESLRVFTSSENWDCSVVQTQPIFQTIFLVTHFIYPIDPTPWKTPFFRLQIWKQEGLSFIQLFFWVFIPWNF